MIISDTRLLAVLLVLSAPGCSEKPAPKRGKPSFTAAVLAAIPEPDPGEFATPQAVVTCYLESVRDYDVGECLKCFPVRSAYEKFDLEDTIRGMRSYSSNFSRVPGADFRNLALTLNKYLLRFNLLTMEFLLGDMPKEPQLLDPGTPEGEKRLRAILSRTHVRNLKDVVIGDVTVEERPSSSIGGHHDRLGGTALAVASARVSYRGREKRVTCVVCKIGDNWRILSVDQ